MINCMYNFVGFVELLMRPRRKCMKAVSFSLDKDGKVVSDRVAWFLEFVLDLIYSVERYLN